MKTINDIKALLLKIKQNYGTSRVEHISNLQDIIWDNFQTDNPELEGILSDLAGDLNFYETDDRDRDEALGYYGDKKLEELVDAALAKINALGA